MPKMPIKSVSNKMFDKLPILNQFDEILRAYNTLVDSSCEKEFLQFAEHFDDCQKKWNLVEQKCMDLQERLTKSEAEKNALFVKLKHARRQIDVEMQGRQKAEQDRDELDNQIMLVRELLLSDSSSTGTLSEEQQKKLDFLNASRFQSPRGGIKGSHRRLDPIDETGSMLSDYSDISFDVTEDDLDGSHLRNGKKWKRGRLMTRRALGGDEDETYPKRRRSDAPLPRGSTAHSQSYHNALDNDQFFEVNHNESIRCTVDGPATMCIEKLEKSFSRPNPHQGRRRPSREHRRRSATTSDSETQSEVEKFWPSAPVSSVDAKSPAKNTQKSHNLQIKPCVITKETCKPCGKRVQFGKKAMKCVDCRLVVHPECEHEAKMFTCDLSNKSPSTNSAKDTIEDYLASDQLPKIPPIIYHTVQEIERRGLSDVGLYRVPGMLRIVRELREKFKGKSIPNLAEVNDVHALCSLVKEFLRVTLREPILTYEHRPTFIEASYQDNDSLMYQVLNELPISNRDTLMFMMLHFQRVVESKETRMSIEALSKAVGPSIVGYSSPEPAMSDLQSAAFDQEKVLTRLLLLPTDYYIKTLEKPMKNNAGTTRVGKNLENTPELHKAPESLLGPLDSPRKTPSSTSLAERAKKYLGGTPFGKGKRKEAPFFASPSLH